MSKAMVQTQWVITSLNVASRKNDGATYYQWKIEQIWEACGLGIYAEFH